VTAAKLSDKLVVHGRHQTALLVQRAGLRSGLRSAAPWRSPPTCDNRLTASAQSSFSRNQSSPDPDFVLLRTKSGSGELWFREKLDCALAVKRLSQVGGLRQGAADRRPDRRPARCTRSAVW